MATIKFYLHNSTKPISNIYFRLSYGAYEMVNGKKKYLPLQYYINENVNTTYWNSKQGRVKNDKRYRESKEINDKLDNIEKIVFDTLKDLISKNIKLSHELLTIEFDKLFKSNVKTEQDYINEAKEQLIPFINNYLNTANYTKGTMKAWTQFLNDLETLESENKKQLSFNDIDLDFHASYISFLKDKGLGLNTIGTRIKMLKTIMRASFDRGLHTNIDFQKRSFTKPSEESENVYLSENELKKIIKLDFSTDNRLDAVRDWFIIGCYTGLRFSDLSQFSRDNIKGQFIEIRTTKTKEKIIAPLHPIVKDIFEKYDYRLPHLISNQKFNDYIKEVCKLADIKETIIIKYTKGTERKTEKYAKYDLISAHTARRSFATNAFNSGIPAIDLMKLTGHRTEKSFLTYIKVSKKENAEKLLNSNFFKGV